MFSIHSKRKEYCMNLNRHGRDLNYMLLRNFQSPKQLSLEIVVERPYNLLNIHFVNIHLISWKLSPFTYILQKDFPDKLGNTISYILLDQKVESMWSRFWLRLQRLGLCWKDSNIFFKRIKQSVRLFSMSTVALGWWNPPTIHAQYNNSQLHL